MVGLVSQSIRIASCCKPQIYTIFVDYTSKNLGEKGYEISILTLREYVIILKEKHSTKPSPHKLWITHELRIRWLKDFYSCLVSMTGQYKTKNHIDRQSTMLRSIWIKFK